MKYTQITKNGWTPIILAYIIVGGMFVPAVYSSISSNPTAIISPYSCEKGTSYVIAKDNSATPNYYAISSGGTSSIPCGTTVYGGNTNLGGATGTNFSAVIQSAINSLQCGSIRLAPQIFNATHGFKLYPCDSLIGMARTGDFGIEPNTTTIFSTDCAHPVITEVVSPSHTNYQVFSEIYGITISATGLCAATQDGIMISNANGAILDTTITDVSIFAMGGNCINSNTGVHTWLNMVYLEDCHQNGLIIGASTGVFMSNSYIFGNSLYGVYDISGGLFQSAHDWYINNAQGALFCANVANNCMLQSGTLQNNGGTSFAQITLSTSASVSANPILIENDAFTDSRGANFAFAAIRMGATQVNAMIENNYFYSLGGAPCFSWVGGGFVASGSLGNVELISNHGANGCTPGKVTGNFLIGGTSATTIHYIGAFGMNGTTPIASQKYVAANTNYLITCSGGTSVNISVIDPSANSIETIGVCPSTAIELPMGFAINFGAFAVAPTVVVYSMSF